MIGRIHSVETFGTVDGPGIRYVIFLQGCNFRCAYCHNPDTWDCHGGIEMSVSELVEDICKYRRYIEGVTISGGEPLMQIDFLIELLTRVKAEGLTTCVDTNGGVFDKFNEGIISKVDKLLDVTDLFLLDIKHIDSSMHRELTGVGNERVLDFANYLSSKGKAMWLRYVLVPTINDSEEILKSWRDYASTLNNVGKIEVLPYHRLAISKYESLGIEYKLSNIKEPTKEQIRFAEDILNNKGENK